MKTLYLVRHAKSDWNLLNLDDFDRPLNKRGLRNAPVMAKRLKKRKIKPEVLISSPAERALSTARIFADVFGYSEKKIIKKPTIYEAEIKDLLKVINHIDDKYGSAMLFGHNPTFTDMVNYLTDMELDNLPTCGVVQVEFDVDNWHEISTHQGKLILFEYPKNED